MNVVIENVRHLGFDDALVKHQHALQLLLRQSVPLTIDGGREVLYWCSSCRTPWYKGGRHETRTHLRQRQLEVLASRLQSDIAVPSLLPHALCPSCACRFFGGIARVEAFLHTQGYRLWWERVPSHLQFLCCLFQSSSHCRQEAVQQALCRPSDIPLPSMPLDKLFHWLAMFPDPEPYQYLPLSASQCALLMASFPPSAPLHWYGQSFQAYCPVLGGWITVILSVTSNQEPPDSHQLLLRCWRQIARVMLLAL